MWDETLNSFQTHRVEGVCDDFGCCDLKIIYFVTKREPWQLVGGDSRSWTL